MKRGHFYIGEKRTFLNGLDSVTGYMFDMEDFEKFYNLALRFLSYRPRSEKEVRQKLQGKKVSPEIIEKIVIKLKEKKFINDEEFAKWFLESRLRFKPRSLRLIKIELKQKGIDPETVNNLQLTINDLENAKKLVEKRMARFRNPTSPSLRGASKFGMTWEKTYQKLGRYLASKGFDWDTIKQVIDEALRKRV